MKDYLIEEQLDWWPWVTPRPLKKKPIHRWFVFPHSFSSDLVHALIDEWGLSANDCILDPFAGAGTTILAAKEKRVPATGYDLSPLAILATRAKLANYNLVDLRKAAATLRRTLNPKRRNGHSRAYPQLVENALPGPLLVAFDHISTRIDNLECSDAERDFFRLSLLAVLPRYSRLVATGGWLQWNSKRPNVQTIPRVFADHIQTMIADLEEAHLIRRTQWKVALADARSLPDSTKHYSAVITSPPYPNRHDYTRVFGVELMFAFLNWKQTRQLRYQSFHSHPEAHPIRPESNGYSPPLSLTRTIARIRKAGIDPRVPRMLEGYFLDLYLCLREMRRVCRGGARVAMIVGNAHYGGHAVLVDELAAQIGEQAGLRCHEILVARYRGNSAQQMAKFGRIPSRESIVLFRLPTYKQPS